MSRFFISSSTSHPLRDFSLPVSCYALLNLDSTSSRRQSCHDGSRYLYGIDYMVTVCHFWHLPRTPTLLQVPWRRQAMVGRLGHGYCVCLLFLRFIAHHTELPLLTNMHMPPASFGRRSCCWYGLDQSWTRRTCHRDRPGESSNTAHLESHRCNLRHNGLCLDQDILGSYDATNCKGNTRLHESDRVVSFGVRQRIDGSGSHPQLFGM